jgi:hypothetical protein
MILENATTIICGNPESYYYTVNVSLGDARKMVALGWKTPQ